MRKESGYNLGVMAYLKSFNVGETRFIDERFKLASMKSLATRLKSGFGCVFKFKGNQITRVK